MKRVANTWKPREQDRSFKSPRSPRAPSPGLDEEDPQWKGRDMNDSVEGAGVGCDPEPETLHPQLSTLNPTPYALNPKP